MRGLKYLLVLAAVAAPLALPVAAKAGPVEVVFVNPNKFHDASPSGFSGKERDSTLNEIRVFLEKKAAAYLRPGQSLKIEVLDVDLAGRTEPWNVRLPDVRIMRDIDSPSMKVRYVLEENAMVSDGGEERISDMSYLWGVRPARYEGDRLKYEKVMLDKWLRKRFGTAAKN